MAENDDASGTPTNDPPTSADHRPVLPPDPAAAATPAPAAPVLRTRWRDRAWSFRAMLAVALATLLIGGFAGGTVVALADDGRDHHDHHHRMGPWGPGDAMPPWRRDHGPRRFGGDGGPQWRWDDGPRPPGEGTSPFTEPPPPTPSPAE
jgi:hypothetical protein